MEKIMIIDDDESGYSTFMRILGDELPAKEYEVIEVGITTSVKDAVWKIETIKPNFILLDMNLGENVCTANEAMSCDGVAVLRETGFNQSNVICVSSSSGAYKSGLRNAGINIHHPQNWWEDLDAIINCVKGECNCFE